MSGEDLLSPEEVRSALREYFDGNPGLAEARLLRDGDPAVDRTGFDRARWAALAGEVGLVAMAAPEPVGGLGLGLAHLTAAAEEAGACLYPGPLRASVLTAWALGLDGPVGPADPADPVGAEPPAAGVDRGAHVTIVPGVDCMACADHAAVNGVSVDGSLVDRVPADGVPVDRVALTDGILAGTVIVGMPQALAAHGPTLTLDADGRVYGMAENVTHGMAADALLAIARTPWGPAVVLVPLNDHMGEGTGEHTAKRTGEVTRRPVRAVDLTARLADLRLDGVPAVPLTTPGDTVAAARTGDVARLLLAAEQVGGAQGCLGHTVEYAKIRTQFDQPIGGYQAIQHRCAEVAIAIAAARALVFAAGRAIDAGDRERAHQLVLLAKAEASEAFDAAAAALIQVHGGIGFTWEHDAHLYFRRARATSVLNGTPSRLRDDAVTAGCLSLLTRAAAGQVR